MDTIILAAPMAAEVVLITAKAVIKDMFEQATVLMAQVVSFPCPSIAGSSISAVAPDYIFKRGTALAAA